MMEPRIQYAKTSDGVSIAYWTLGEGGTPLVWMPGNLYRHGQLEWQIPELTQFYHALAEDRRLIGYDSRGSGLSQRDETDLTVEGFVNDLEAVADALGLEQFDLFGHNTFSFVTLAYAARHPERVSRLILWCAAATFQNLAPAVTALLDLRNVDFSLYTEAIAHEVIRWSAGEQARQAAALMRESTSPEAVRTYWDHMRDFDVTTVAPRVEAPTLVIHRRGTTFPPLDHGRQLATLIPNAQLVVLDGEAVAFYLGESAPVLRGIKDSLDEGDRRGQLPIALSSGMTAILFLDIADSTALTEQLGDAAFRKRARQLDEALVPAIRDAGGMIVEGKLLGDGVLATFSSARLAIEAARRCRDASAESGLGLHLGIHAGDVIREANNVFGGAVNLAARIADASKLGEILVSDTLRGLARTSAGVVFEDRGEYELKGIAEPVRLFAVRDRDAPNSD